VIRTCDSWHSHIWFMYVVRMCGLYVWFVYVIRTCNSYTWFVYVIRDIRICDSTCGSYVWFLFMIRIRNSWNSNMCFVTFVYVIREYGLYVWFDNEIRTWAPCLVTNMNESHHTLATFIQVIRTRDMRVTWPIHLCDKPPLHVWHTTFLCIPHLNVCHDLFPYATRLADTWHDALIDALICGTWLIVLCVSWPIPICGTARWFVTRRTHRRTHMWDMTHSSMCVMTHSYMRHGSLICDTTHS